MSKPRSPIADYAVYLLVRLFVCVVQMLSFPAACRLSHRLAMVVLLLRHLDKAPFYKHVDPILQLTDKRPKEVERISLELVDALERAYGRPRRRTKSRS